MGFSIGEAQYLSAPPYVLACISMWTLAWIGDRYRIRGPLLLVNCTLGFIGAPLLGWGPSAGVRYFGTFLICASAQGGIQLEGDSTHLTSSLCQSDSLAITLVVCLVTYPMTSGSRLPCKRRPAVAGYLATPGLRSVALNYYRICISIPSFYWL
jgi:hypothetical protein